MDITVPGIIYSYICLHICAPQGTQITLQYNIYVGSQLHFNVLSTIC